MLAWLRRVICLVATTSALCDIATLVARRTTLRRERAYAEADAVLLELKARGVVVRDLPDGASEWRLAAPRPDAGAANVLAAAKGARAFAARADVDDAAAAARVAEAGAEALAALDAFDAAVVLPGRRAADAAFHFALAGAADDELFARLAAARASELARTGGDNVNDAQAAEKLAAAAVEGDFFSPRAAVWRWRYTASPDGPRPAGGDDDLVDDVRFDDPSKPLVVDLGCGLGASALALARDGRVNVLACDAAPGCVRAARAFAARLGVRDVRFAACGAAAALRWAAARYPGPVARALVQFPTPFSLEEGRALRSGMDFMLTPEVAGLARVAEEVYVASNCEDVALRCANVLEAAGWDGVAPEDPVLLPRDGNTLREARALAVDGRRAVGGPWRLSSPVPWTDSEHQCEAQGAPVHRALFRRR